MAGLMFRSPWATALIRALGVWYQMQLSCLTNSHWMKGSMSELRLQQC